MMSVLEILKEIKKLYYYIILYNIIIYGGIQRDLDRLKR